jgi:2-(3-amino-3-carboxypropyl)histidine synthase
MKSLFIPVIINSPLIENIKKISKKLPKSIAISYSVQYKKIAEEIKKSLQEEPKKHQITKFVQTLGCMDPKFPKGTEAVLLIGSGKFHGISLALETKLPIYIYNKNLVKISEKEIESLRIRKKAAYVRFLNAKKIGILVSTKPGQENLKRALSLKKSLKDKESYLFIGDNLNPSEFQNFQIESWINTACPRLDLDFSVINEGDLLKISVF